MEGEHMRKLPEELAQHAIALFPVNAEDKKDPTNRVFVDQVQRGSLAVPELIRIKARPEIDPSEILALAKSLEKHGDNNAYVLKDALKDKATALKNGARWGIRNQRKLKQVLRLADKCEAALAAQGLNDHPIVLLPQEEAEAEAA